MSRNSRIKMPGVGKGGNPRRCSPERIARIRTAIEAGQSYAEIALAEGICAASIYQLVKRYDLPRSTRKSRRQAQMPAGDRAPRLCACGQMGFAGLTFGGVAFFSPEDLSVVGDRLWFQNGSGYACRCEGGRTIRMHCEVAGPDIDHKSRDRSDNRRENLRPADLTEQGANRRSWGSIAYKGVSPQGNGKGYRARVRSKGKTIVLGAFPTPEDAARAYDRAAAQLHGEFAATNVSLGLLPQEAA